MGIEHDPTAVPLRVFAVGSSAGGIEALTALLATALPGRNDCFVVAQHLSSTDESVLPGLLDKITPLRVVAADDGAALAADTVVVAPPGVDIVVEGTVLRVVDPDGKRRPWPSIDRLFTSVALSYGSRAVAILLSGNGEDGSAGVESIHSAGGFVAVQDPATASFAGMPGAGVATGTADLVLPVEQILPESARVLDQAAARAVSDNATALWLDDTALEGVITVLRDVTGVDFSGYKRSTLLRQIQRRQRLVDLSIRDYVERVGADLSEAEAVGRNVLVSVTAFFRDPEVWEAVALQLHVMAGDLGNSAELRLWVPGCASGEEAFTLAMLAAEAIAPRSNDKPLRLKVFATDLDERALAIARRGRYSDAAVASIPEHLRARWMQRVGSEWEVTPMLREALVIARHNAAYDPPFPRIALISLRNTMIYFQNYLQERVLQLCHFALAPGGVLVLGQSERIPRVDTLFTVIDPTNRLYRRGTTTRIPHLPSGHCVPTSHVPLPAQLPSGHEPSSTLFRRLLATVAPPSLVLDDTDTVTEVIGDVSPWCAVSVGHHTGHVSDLIRERFQTTVRTMLSQLRHSTPPLVTRVVAAPGPSRVEITAARLVGDGIGSVLTFRTLADHESASLSADRGSAVTTIRSVESDDAVLTHELQATQDALQSTIEDLSSFNEELQALNEELRASSEELQATSEEAQASNEELEATNEELTTLNSELQLRGNELIRVNVDMQNIQSSLTSGLVIVDRELRVTRYTPLAVRLFSLINEDIGRALPAVPTTIPIPGLAADLEATIRSRTSNMRELTSDDRDLLLQTQPYIGSDDDVRGVIVIVIDVGDIAVERRVRESALRNLHLVAESVRELVWQRAVTGELTMVTSRVEQLYGLDRSAVQADPGLLLAAVHPADRDRVQTATASADRQWQLEYRIVRSDGSVRWIDESARFVPGVGNEPGHIVGSSLDITERRELRDLADRRTAVLDAVLRTEDTGVLVLDADDRVLSANAGISALTGYTSSFLTGTPLTVLLEPDTPTGSEVGADVTHRIVTSEGVARPVTVEMQPVEADLNGSGDAPRRIALVRDISRMREITTELAKREQYDLQTGLLTRTYLRSKTAELMAANLSRIALLWIDLDGFKEVNDRFGHRAGDLVLATIATRLHQAARRYDIVGRLGGDEFALLVTRVHDLDGLDSLALRILSAIREPIPLQDSLAYVSASVGVAVYPQDASNADDLLHNADTAMYVAKDRGRDRHAYFAQEMNSAADERAAMRQRLGAALSHNDFEMHYQPVVDIGDGSVAMIEALVRWRRDGEVVSAAEFINYAADTGQMRALGRIVLNLVDADITALYVALGDRQPTVALNLSVTELDERDITDWLLAWAPAGGLGKIVAEVTESVLLGPESRALDTLGLLRRLGATISIDDFGTGYSNLELLDRLEPGIIKVDRSLLRRAREDARGVNILQAAIQLAHALDARVVLEGVEDADMLGMAGDNDADLAQGYHIARPMPLAEIIEWIAQRP